MFLLLLTIFSVTNIDCQSTAATYGLQQCAADLACSLDFRNAYQTKLDNLSNFMELQVMKLRDSTNTILTPLQGEMSILKSNTTTRLDAVDTAMSGVQAELAHDRVYLGNLTRGLYILNDEFRREQTVRYQDVHRLVQEADGIKSAMAAMQAQINKLLGLPANTTITPILMPPAVKANCTDKDVLIQELQKNLTTALSENQKTLTLLKNTQIIETFLQKTVRELKGNLTNARLVLDVKDKAISNLQNVVHVLQTRPTSSPLASCHGELGMRDGRIPDRAIAASDVHTGYHASNARLNSTQGWYTSEKNASADWLQIDLGSVHYVTKVATQGAPCCDVMVTNYTLMYSNDGHTWKLYQEHCAAEYFQGNSDKATIVEHALAVPIVARYIRFSVINFNKMGPSNYVGMRVELYGCPTNYIKK